METQSAENETFDARQSLQVIREMIDLSRKKMQNDGILFIIWGWSLFYSSFTRFLISKVLFSKMQVKAFKTVGTIITMAVLGYTLYYLWQQRKKVKTYIGISLRYVWIAAILCMVLINLIQGNILHDINFELQHPIFMVILAFAVVVTGVLLRYRLMIFAGLLFGLLAYAASFFELHIQLLLEAIAWFLAFCIPGHLLYAKRTK